MDFESRKGTNFFSPLPKGTCAQQRESEKEGEGESTHQRGMIMGHGHATVSSPPFLHSVGILMMHAHVPRVFFQPLGPGFEPCG